jgi:peroxiredoxin
MNHVANVAPSSAALAFKHMICIKCYQGLTYRPEQVGKLLRCPGCRHLFRIHPNPNSKTGSGILRYAGQDTGKHPTPLVRNGTPQPTAPVNGHASGRIAAKPQAASTPKAALKTVPTLVKRRPTHRNPTWLVPAMIGVGSILLLSGGGLAAKLWWEKETGIAKNKGTAAYARHAGYGAGYQAGSFNDDAQANTRVASGALALTFIDTKGETIDLASYRGKKHVVLIVMRGFPGYVCPSCSAQTSRLIGNYPEFVKRNAEVLVVFPGARDHLPDFVKASQAEAANTAVPFPILLDENFQAVDQLHIRGDLAKPSTYLIDKQGQVRFAYVGATSADRPSVKALLQQLDHLPKK